MTFISDRYGHLHQSNKKQNHVGTEYPENYQGNGDGGRRKNEEGGRSLIEK